jgi:hypothetical protein
MAGVVVLIWGRGKTDYFCKQDWTGQISLIRHDNSGFPRTMEPLRTASEQLLVRCIELEQKLLGQAASFVALDFFHHLRVRNQRE